MSLNRIDPPAKGETLTLEAIPEWNREDLADMRNDYGWKTNLAFDPQGEKEPMVASRHPLSDVSRDPAEELSPAELDDLWRRYSSEFDFPVKVRNPFGSYDVYFVGTPANDATADHPVCRGGDQYTVLEEPFTPGESVVLETWLGLSQQNGFAACNPDPSSGNEYDYRIDLTNEDWLKKVQDRLTQLIMALEWEMTNTNPTASGVISSSNPFNLDSLPLMADLQDNALLLNKVLQMQLQLDDVNFTQKWRDPKYIVAGGAAAGYLFALAAHDLQMQGGPVTWSVRLVAWLFKKLSEAAASSAKITKTNIPFPQPALMLLPDTCVVDPASTACVMERAGEGI